MKKLAPKFWLLIASAALVAASGCAVGPNYHRPSAPVPPSFKEAPPQGWKEAQPNEAISRGKWWEMYNDPQLNALEEQVSISNQNVLAAMALYREARDTVKIARSNFFPTVSASPGVTNSRTSSTLTQVSPGTFISGTRTDYSLPFDISYQADVFGSVRRGVRGAKAQAQASDAQLENVRLTLQSELAQFYFQLRGLDSQEDLLKRTVDIYKDYLQLTQARFEVGVASQADVLLAQTQLSTTQAQLIDVGVSRAQFEHAIAVLTGKPPAALSIAFMPLKNLPPATPTGVPSTLLERRPDIATAERQAAAANEQIGIAKAAFFPTLTLTATAGFQSTSAADWLTWPSRFWTVGPQLAAVLFQGGKRRAELDLQRAAYDAAAANYRQTVLTAFQQVEDNLAALRILEQEAEAEDLAVKQARESVDISTEQYKAGIVNYLQVITAQATALQNERAAIDVQTRRMTSSVLLVEALGGGWDTSKLPQP
jgi:NodT family efflux transporter outer membrane factor (OMF) lipoprotein